jgi:O-acetyl-ADP-ribose deacetylase (regulator of RNase III)
MSSLQVQGTIRELYYITHIDNIPSILKNGILSHQNIIQRGLKYTPIYDECIISRRKEIKTPNGKSLWDFANLFFEARNPMLFRVKCEKDTYNLAIIGVEPSVFTLPGVYVTTGNAAHSQSEILAPNRVIMSKILKNTKKEYWSEHDGSKRKIMAECLVPNEIPASLIKAIYVADHDSKYKVDSKLANSSIPVIPEPHMFFSPSEVIIVTPKLFVMQGDMFFSRLQTLTVSVNTVGIMGKGIASRAKYQFPDVYVYYQDLCRLRKLKMGVPALYKREASTDYQMADEPESMSCANGETWFLLFPTKRHWREDADIDGIEKGLQWIVENYWKEGIKSLALPALGCGLGNLDWKQIGPLMCKYLSLLDIPVFIYLPAEKKIPEKFLDPNFLLSRKT